MLVAIICAAFARREPCCSEHDRMQLHVEWSRYAVEMKTDLQINRCPEHCEPHSGGTVASFTAKFRVLTAGHHRSDATKA